MVCNCFIQIITYTLGTSTVWPSRQTARSFLSGTGKEIIRSIVTDYFDRLSTELSTLNLQLDDLKNDFDDNMTSLRSSMKAYIDSTDVAEEFVM